MTTAHNAAVNVTPLPVDLYELPIKLSNFEHEWTQPMAVSTDWGSVARQLADLPQYGAKKDCPLLNLAVFGDKATRKADGTMGSRRNNANVVEHYGVVADYDGRVAPGITFDEAVARLKAAHIEAVVYTSPSHMQPKTDKDGKVIPAGPRWRVVAPFREPRGPEQYAQYVSLLNGALGGVLDSESWDISRCYYYGRVRGVDYRCERISSGMCLDDDVAAMLTAPVGRPGKVERSSKQAAQKTDDARQRGIASATEETLDDLASALDYLAQHTDWADNRDTWIDVGHALASLKGTEFEEAAFELWDEFSQTSDKYDPGDIESRWHGMNPGHITFASVFHWAQEAGWKNPRVEPRKTAQELDWPKQEERTSEQQARIEASNARIEHLHRPEFAATTWDDVGNANLLRNLTDGNLRYVVELERWIVWDGKQWTLDHDGSLALAQARQVGAYYKALAAKEEEEAKKASDDKEKKRRQQTADTIQKWSTQCWTGWRLSNMLHLLRSDSAVRIAADQLDANQWLLGVKNGVVDLKTGTLRAAARDDLITRRVAVPFDPGAKCPLWEKTVAEITGTPIPPERDAEDNIIRATVGRFTPRPEMVQYLQRCAGYWLSGSIAEHVMFFFYGPTGSGKTLLLDAMHAAIGDYATTIDTESLMANSRASARDASTPTIAALMGIRAAFGSETKPEQHWDEKTIKWLTGDTNLTGRKPHGQKLDFQNTSKLICYGNHAPRFSATEYAMHARIHTIPCIRQWNRPSTQMYDPGLPDGDKTLLDRIKATELPGLLAWMVRGCVGYLAHGLQAPADVAQATRAYIAKQGRIGQWVETLERVPVDEGTPASQLFEAFMSSPLVTILPTPERAKFNSTMFAAELERLNVEGKKTRSVKLWGLRLPLSEAGRVALAAHFG